MGEVGGCEKLIATLEVAVMEVESINQARKTFMFGVGAWRK